MKKSGSTKHLWLVFVVGIPVFLLMVHPLIFFLVFVPLVIVGIVKLVSWIKK